MVKPFHLVWAKKPLSIMFVGSYCPPCIGILTGNQCFQKLVAAQLSSQLTHCIAACSQAGWRLVSPLSSTWGPAMARASAVYKCTVSEWTLTAACLMCPAHSTALCLSNTTNQPAQINTQIHLFSNLLLLTLLVLVTALEPQKCIHQQPKFAEIFKKTHKI